MHIKEQLLEKLGNFRIYWKRPPLGRYMTYREIASLSFGGMGVKLIVYCVQNMILSVGNTLIGNTIGIAPKPLYAIYFISVIAGFPLTALRAQMIDSARNKKGKYRPYILSMCLPTVLLGLAFTWMPYDKMSLFVKCAVVLAFNIGFQFFYVFFTDAYESLTNVLSPNTIERSDVASIKAVTDNFTPSIAGIFLPMVARAITGEDTLYDMRIYRVIFPPMLLVGAVLSVLVYANTQEKIVQAKTHIVQMKFADSLRAVAKNKYFWILSCASWIGFLEDAFKNILQWLYNYQGAASAAQYSLITAISGNAHFWPMLFAPFFIRAFGKRNILIVTNLMNIGFILMMYPVIVYSSPTQMIWLLLVCFFINSMVTALGHILNPSLNGDIRDYQQYVTGERIDGTFVAVGLVGSVVTLLTSSVLPAINDWAGMNETVARSLGYDGSNVYDVLYNTETFNKICGVLIVASAVGAFLNVIPFFFYDLTEVKQKAMVTVLKIRALFEDYGNNALTDESLVEAIDLINTAQTFNGKARQKPQKPVRGGGNLERRAAKAQYRQQQEDNTQIEIAPFVLEEINRFDTPRGQAEIAYAQQILSAGLNGFLNVAAPSVQEARALPKGTPTEKSLRRDAMDKAQKRITAEKTLKKHYPNGLEPLDTAELEQLFLAQDENEIALREALKTAGKNSKGALSALRAQKKELAQSIKTLMDANALYHRAAAPYLDAQKLLTQRDNYARYEEIAANYEQSKQRAKAERAERDAKDAAERAEKEAYARKLREERAAAKKK